MAFSNTAKAGPVPYRMFDPGEEVLVPGDPGVTYTKGNMHNILPAAGVATVITDSLPGGILRCTKTTVCPAATTAFPALKDLRDWDDNQAERLCFVPMNIMIPAQQVYAARFLATQGTDETVVTYSAASRYIENTTGFGADDRGNGALCYVYEGTGAGEINIQEDYDHAGGAAGTMSTYHRKFNATLDTTSKVLTLGNATDANVVGPMGLLDPYDGNDLDVADGYDDGDWMVLPSWRDIAVLLPTGALPVVRFKNELSA